MNIDTLKKAILLCKEAGVTPHIWGHRGLGKSQVTAQTCAENNLGFIDMRLSQCEASDLRGLPCADRDNNQTVFLPPNDLPVGGMTFDEFTEELQILPTLEQCLDEKDLAGALDANPALATNPTEACKLLAGLGFNREADAIARKRAENTRKLDHGILFLDEINRAQDDVLQAVFQLVLDRRIGSYVLPTGWHIVCAGNFMEGYMTNGFTDPAFLDRFAHLTLDGGELTLEEWVNFISNHHGDMAAPVIEFATQNVKHLDGDIKGEIGFSIQPSRRSWEAVIRVEKACDDSGFSADAKLAVIAGLVGHEAAVAYSHYSCPVRPRDLISRGVAAYESKLKELRRAQMTGLCWGLVSYLKGKTDEKSLTVARDFVKFLVVHGSDKDIAVAFANMMIDVKDQKLRSALVSNPAVARLVGRYKTGNKKTFITMLQDDPELQDLLSKTAWGSEPEESK